MAQDEFRENSSRVQLKISVSSDFVRFAHRVAEEKIYPQRVFTAQVSGHCVEKSSISDALDRQK